MKKVYGLILCAMLAGATAFGQSEARRYQLSAVGTAAVSNYFVLRGELYSIYVDVPAGSPTGTVAVTTDFGSAVAASSTLFSLAGITADALYSPRIATHNTAGAAQTYFSENVGIGTVTNSILTQPILAGGVMVKVTQTNWHTNDWNVYIIYRDR